MALVIADLGPVKAKLGIPLTDSSSDASLQLALDAAEETVLDRTGFAAEAETGRIDRFSRLQEGRFFYLSRRPVAAITTVQGKRVGSTDWESLAYELTNADDGQVVLTGELASWGPTYQRDPSAEYAKWSELTWDVVAVTYDVSAATIPARIRNAIVSLAAYIHIRESSHAIDLRTGGGVSEKYRDEDIPPWVSGPIAGYERQRRTLWAG